MVEQIVTPRNSLSTATRYQPCWHDYQLYIRRWAFESLFYTQTGMASVNHDSNSLGRYKSGHVSMYLHVTIFMTFGLWQSWEMEKKYLQIPISATFFSIFSSPEPKAHMSTLGVRRLSSTINLSQFLLSFLENHWTEFKVDHHKYTKHLFGHLANLF